MRTLGVLLAGGAGRRMGTPKALLRDLDGTPFLARAIGILLEGGCDRVVVVTGAAADRAGTVLDETGWTLDPAVRVVVAADWDQGMGASLRAGLAAAADGETDCALVSLVDLPDVGASVVDRLLRTVGPGSTALGRASYDGVAGHPVMIGRDHWAGVVASAHGDKGARDYLKAHEHVLVECGDLATGRDTDTPDDLVR
ncbi:MAG TPA: nucleotidyltransferase family protein [Nocardioidaceae bacterium]|nr:nucleotidyltransferase family protein [Nocardioidaceae bacterium]